MPRILVITSCTGQKAISHPHQLTRDDFAKGPGHVVSREKALGTVLKPAGELYTGEQHQRLNRGVVAARAAGADVDFWILSAGYGLVPAHQPLAPYECTFATMGRRQAKQWAEQIGVPNAFRSLASRSYDCAIVLLGDCYLQACAIASDVCFTGPTLILAGEGAAAKLPRLANLRVQPLRVEDTRRFRCGLIGLKGEVAGRLLPLLATEGSLIRHVTDPSSDLLSRLVS